MLDGLKPAFEKLKAMPEAKRSILCSSLSNETITWKQVFAWMEEDPEVGKSIREEYIRLVEKANLEKRRNND